MRRATAVHPVAVASFSERVPLIDGRRSGWSTRAGARSCAARG